MLVTWRFQHGNINKTVTLKRQKKRSPTIISNGQKKRQKKNKKCPTKTRRFEMKLLSFGHFEGTFGGAILTDGGHSPTMEPLQLEVCVRKIAGRRSFEKNRC